MSQSGEFDLIARFFAPLASGYPGAYDLTDDAALLDVSDGNPRVVATDMLVEGVHFLPDDPADRIAQKALRVNLSDIAAMGAEPEGYTLAMSLSTLWDDAWLEAAAAGLRVDQDRFGVHLLGGDTVSSGGVASLSITVIGSVPNNQILRRSGAVSGDDLYVSGTIGDAGLGLRLLQENDDSGIDPALRAAAISRYQLPEPRLRLGLALRSLVNACIDVSDGLVADLTHLAESSDVAAILDLAAVPWSAAVEACADYAVARRITAGDDYELLFAAPASRRSAVEAAAETSGTVVTRIGSFASGAGIRILDPAGDEIEVDDTGYRHR
ncbi:MAG: thiamine-phosphate kinase [Rhodospirillaceae bacterium]|nr:thiamine-phosphate kinase [Rhodospirillaceae bacterium]MCY4239830.1 thiamine-phosphate kinase [Rhodospirillaceae bacterium]MCY4310128.1 thiamine-phosphate kinase [Rhodospirillaceae bacterium]